MTVEYTERDLFSLDVDMLINSVNTVGIMGAGIAKKFKEKFPEMYKDYREACKTGKIYVDADITVTVRKNKIEWDFKVFGWKPHIWIGEDIIILNFPTKIDWRWPSSYEIITEGLKWLRKNIGTISTTANREVKYVGLPKLGCGLGGLKWSKVKTLIEKYLSGLNEVFIVSIS